MHKFEESVLREFAKLDYVPTQVEKMDHLLHAIREFLQYAGSQQYYGDAINKKLFSLTLEADDASLQLEQLALQAGGFHDEVQKAVLTKRKPKIEKAVLQDFKKQMMDFEKQLNLLCQECRQLIQTIRAESRHKEGS